MWPGLQLKADESVGGTLPQSVKPSIDTPSNAPGASAAFQKCRTSLPSYVCGAEKPSTHIIYEADGGFGTQGRVVLHGLFMILEASGSASHCALSSTLLCLIPPYALPQSHTQRFRKGCQQLSLHGGHMPSCTSQATAVQQHRQQPSSSASRTLLTARRRVASFSQALLAFSPPLSPVCSRGKASAPWPGH